MYIQQEAFPELYEKIESILSQLQSYLTGNVPFTLLLDDPAGNSYIENLNAPNPDPQITIKQYTRTHEQNEAMGLSESVAPVDQELEHQQQQQQHQHEKGEEEEEEETGITKDDLAFKEEIHTFPGNCSRCNIPSETKMHMLGKYPFIFYLFF
jgi:zinc finger protein